MKSHVSKLEAAVMLGVSLRTIDAMVKRDELPVIWCMGRPRIPLQAIERLGKSTSLALRRAAPAEIVPAEPPQDPLPEVLFDMLIERKIAKMAARSADSIFEPFFQSKAVTDEIRRAQPAWERAKFTLRYAKWGCMICQTKKVRHCACAMCQKCYNREAARFEMVIKQGQDAFRKRAPMLIHDLTEEAKAALHLPVEDAEYPEREP